VYVGVKRERERERIARYFTKGEEKGRGIRR